MIKTTDPNFVKDPKTGAVVAADLSQYEQVKAARARAKMITDLEARVQMLEARLAKLESAK